jgi:hypothetical protein
MKNYEWHIIRFEEGEPIKVCTKYKDINDLIESLIGLANSTAPSQAT